MSDNFNWVSENVCEINGGGDVVFTGIVRGQGLPPLTYIGSSIEEVTEGLILSEWIYYVKEGKS